MSQIIDCPSVGVVLVTYNRAFLLSQSIDAILNQQVQANITLYVVDNASIDQTAQIVASKPQAQMPYIRSRRNLGGAGGFCLGLKTAYQMGHEWLWLLDDDILAAPDCLANLLHYMQYPVLMPAREDKNADLAEYSALRYNLKNPFYIQAKREQVCDRYQKREELPELLPIANFSFEGLLLHRSIVKQVGLPFAEYFIAGDDTDYAQRVTRRGFPIYLVKDARVQRQLHFNKQEALFSWKGYYMLRNMFVIHFLHGENFLVRLKPYWLMLGAILTGKSLKNKNLRFSLLKDARRLAKDIKQQHSQWL